MKELEQEFKQKAIEKGVEVVTDVDLEAFMKAAESAYQVLGLVEARDALVKEIIGE